MVDGFTGVVGVRRGGDAIFSFTSAPLRQSAPIPRQNLSMCSSGTARKKNPERSSNVCVPFNVQKKEPNKTKKQKIISFRQFLYGFEKSARQRDDQFYVSYDSFHTCVTCMTRRLRLPLFFSFDLVVLHYDQVPLAGHVGVFFGV